MKMSETNHIEIDISNDNISPATDNADRRIKFDTFDDKEKINNNTNINTDDTDELSYENEIPNNINSVHEFSISTLDRKLKEMKKQKIKIAEVKKNKSMTIKNKNNGENNPEPRFQNNQQLLNQNSNSYKQFNTNRMNKVNIMIDPTTLINEHMNEIQLRIIGHNRSSILYERRDKIMGYPVTILSSFLASSIMISITDDSSSDKYIVKYISLTLSIISFLLSVSRDYLNFARKFQSHDLSSKLYTTLLRSVEVRLINNHLDNDEKRDIFKDIIDQMSIIEQYEIPVPCNIDSEIRKDHT